MPRRSRSGRDLQLNTIPISPLALVKGYVSSVTTQVRETVDLVQRVASTVKSVDVVEDDVKVSFAPEKLDGRSTLRVPLGQQNLGLRGDFNLEQEGREVLLTLKLDAYLLDQVLGRRMGSLVSQATCRFNTKIRITLQDTIDMDSGSNSAASHKRLGKPRAR